MPFVISRQPPSLTSGAAQARLPHSPRSSGLPALGVLVPLSLDVVLRDVRRHWKASAVSALDREAFSISNVSRKVTGLFGKAMWLGSDQSLVGAAFAEVVGSDEDRRTPLPTVPLFPTLFFLRASASEPPVLSLSIVSGLGARQRGMSIGPSHQFAYSFKGFTVQSFGPVSCRSV